MSTTPEAGHRKTRAPAPAKLFHQLPRLFELLHEAVDVLDAHTAAGGDSLATRSVEDVGLCTLVRRHRENDRFDAADLALVDVDVAHRRRDAGNHLHEIAQR